MYKESQRPQVTCPLIDDFHVLNILGARERREIIFGTQIYMDGTHTYLAQTFAGLTGGLLSHPTATTPTGPYVNTYSVGSVDHFQVLLQQVGTWAGSKIPADVSDLSGANLPTLIPYINNKTSTGFTVNADNHAVLDAIIKVTLPAHPRATPKDASSYCPYCKHYGFKDICGSLVRDATLFAGTIATGGTSATVTFAKIRAAVTHYLTPSTRTLTGADGQASPAISIGGGSMKKYFVTEMVFTDTSSYQIILMKSPYIQAVGANYPYPSAKAADGFTITGSNSSYDVLILGQVKN
jgi:hypothetical protein